MYTGGTNKIADTDSLIGKVYFRDYNEKVWRTVLKCHKNSSWSLVIHLGKYFELATLIKKYVFGK